MYLRLERRCDDDRGQEGNRYQIPSFGCGNAVNALPKLGFSQAKWCRRLIGTARTHHTAQASRAMEVALTAQALSTVIVICNGSLATTVKEA